MASYYNEIDPYAAAWLRNLIAAGHVAPGDVDERSIEDVSPDDLRGYTQCHFFAGIAAWSYALRLAGWADDREVWTGSCPCQPFSAAGQGLGFADERHLWPAFYHLISECNPSVVFGEQVASKDTDPWIDLVQLDMEALGHAFGSVPFPSAGVGAPHIRDRNFWVANADKQSGRQRREIDGRRDSGSNAQSRAGSGGGGGVPGILADAVSERRDGQHALLQRNKPGRDTRDCVEAAGCSEVSVMADADDTRLERRERVRERSAEFPARSSGVAGWLADADGGDAGAEREQRGGEQRQQPQDSGVVQLVDAGRSGLQLARPSPTNGFWRAADWLLCRDGKWRPVEPGTFPLAHGATSRVGRLRAYGNAINAEAARVFIRTTIDVLPYYDLV